MTTNRVLLERRERVIPRGVGRLAGDSVVASSRGAHLMDADGRELIDFAGGLGVMNVGNGDDRVVAAIREQSGRLLHACIHVSTYEPYVALCEKLVELLPHGESTKALLVNSGSEAVENAIKIARQATGRAAVVCYSEASHGRTMMSMSLTSKTDSKLGCGPFAPEVYRLPFPDRFKRGRGLSAEEFSAGELARLEEAFGNRVAANQVAAIIIEPVQGEGGFVPAPIPYLEGLRGLCDRLGILLIFDEVQTGFGRTGRWAAYEHSGVVPDLSTWAKSLGGGMPIGAVLGRSEIMDAAAPGTIGGTQGGNPVACAAALAAIDVMESLQLNDRARAIGKILRSRFLSLQKQTDLVADVRGLGAMMALELCVEGNPAKPASGAAQCVVECCLKNDLLLLTAGRHGNVIRVLCPLVITDEVLVRGLDVLESAILSLPEISQN